MIWSCAQANKLAKMTLCLYVIVDKMYLGTTRHLGAKPIFEKERRLNLWIFTALSGQQQLSFNILLLRLHPWRHVPYIILLNSLEIQVHHQKCWAMLSYCLLSLFVAIENWKIHNFTCNKVITLLYWFGVSQPVTKFVQ